MSKDDGELSPMMVILAVAIGASPVIWVIANEYDGASQAFETSEFVEDCVAEARELLEVAQDSEGALAVLQSGSEKFPDSAQLSYWLGVTRLRMRDLDAAQAGFARAVELDPKMALAHNNLGALLRQKGQVQESLTHFQQAVQSRKDYDQALANLGRTLCMLGRHKAAIEPLEASLELNPDVSSTHSMYAIALQRTGNAAQARVHFQKALALDASNPEAIRGLGGPR